MKHLSVFWRVNLGIAISATLILFSVSCGSSDKENQNEYIKLVKTANVNEISSMQLKTYPGIIEEAEELNLAFRVAGPIERIYVTEGQYVVKGQLIAEMDPRDYIIQKNAVESQVIQIQSEYARIEELNKLKTVADNDYEKMKAGKEMAEVKLQNATDQLNDTKIYAPYSGYITKVMYEEGELVNIGTPIASLIDISMLKVEINVPTSMYLNKDKITKLEFTQESMPDKVFPLELYADNKKANSNGLYKLYMKYNPENDSDLVPGMNISVNLTYSTNNSSTLSIPVKAVFTKNNENYVWVVKNGKVNARKITTNNLINNGFIGVSDGLSKNEQVVIGGLNLLVEDEVVNTMPQKSETNVGNIL